MPRYCKNLEWLRPFVEAAAKKRLFPAHRLVRVRGYRTSLGREESQYGSCAWEGPWFYVNLRTHVKIPSTGRRRWYHRPCRASTILGFLAHELSHMTHKDHDAAHLALEARILAVFAATAHRLGVRDLSAHYDRVRLDTKRKN